MPGGDLDSHLAKPVQDFWLGHLAGEGEDDDHRPDPWPKLPLVAWGQLRQIDFPLAWRVELLFAEQDIVSMDHHILHYHFLVALELGIRRQHGWVYW